MKIEMHLHTSEASNCALMDADEVCRRYKDAGYDLLVLTNHFTKWYVGKPFRKGEAVYTKEFFTSAYELFEKTAEKYGLRTLMGMEFNVYQTGDFLIYGDNKFIVDRYPEVFDLSVKEISELCKENGALLYQAHPFRNDMRITRPDLLFGIESVNGAVTHDSRNDIAKLWAEKFSLHTIGGSDCHYDYHVGTVALETDMDIRTNDDLLEMLRTDNYKIVEN